MAFPRRFSPPLAARLFAVGAAALAALHLAGCGPDHAAVPATRPAASSPADAATRPAQTPWPAPATAPWVIPGQPLKGAELFRLHSAEGAYDIAHDDALTPNVPYTLTPDEQGGWILSIGELRRVYMREEEGAVLVTREEELDENVSITYTPALRMLPASLTLNRPQEFDCQVVVRNLKDQSVRDKGDCRYSVEYIGEQRVQTPSGEHVASIVRSTRQINLNLASVRVALQTAYVPARGAVVQRVEEVRRMLGLFSSRSVEESRLAK